MNVFRAILVGTICASTCISQQSVGPVSPLIAPNDPAPCSLVWPKFGGVYPVDDMVYFMFFCKLPEKLGNLLKEEQGKIQIEWNVFQYNDNTGNYDFLKNGLENVFVNPSSGTISRDFKFRLFQKATLSNVESMKFAMRIFIGGLFVDSMNTIVVPADDSLLTKVIGEQSVHSSCAYDVAGQVCAAGAEVSLRHMDFIEIGTSGFDTLIEVASDDLMGLSIEPLKHLQDTLPNRENIVKISCAIGDAPGWKDIYYLPSYFMEFNNVDLKDYSEAQFLYGLGRVGEISQSVVGHLGKRGFVPPYLLHVERALVRMKTVAQIFSEQAVSGVTFLKLDCEGFDYKIMQAAFQFFESSSVKLPLLIEFENNSDYSAAAAVVDVLLRLGYNVYSFFYEVTKVVHDSSIDAPHGVIFAEIIPARRSSEDEGLIEAIIDITPSDLKWGRGLCAEHHQKREQSLPSRGTAVKYESEPHFCSILLSPSKEVLSISNSFVVL